MIVGVFVVVFVSLLPLTGASSFDYGNEVGGKKCLPLDVTMARCWSMCGDPFPGWIKVVHFAGEFLNWDCLRVVPNKIKVSDS